MKTKKQAGNVLLILAVCFVVVFAIAIVFVNNWLKQSLKDETVVKNQGALNLKKSQYRQAPMGPIGVAPETAAGVQKKSVIPGNPAEAEKKAAEPRVITGERILVN